MRFGLVALVALVVSASLSAQESGEVEEEAQGIEWCFDAHFIPIRQYPGFFIICPLRQDYWVCDEQGCRDPHELPFPAFVLTPDDEE